MSYPVCPSCGEQCGRLARICVDCGAYLYEPTPSDRLERAMLIRNGLAALRREDEQATREREA